MDIGEYVVARHPMLVRAAVLMGRPLDRARALVEETLAVRARSIRRSEDPDPDVLHALHAAVLADRVEQPGEADPTGRPDQAPGLDDEGLAVRHTLGGMTPELRDAAVLLFFAHLSAADAADALGVKRRDLPPVAAAALEGLGAEDTDLARHALAQGGDTIVVEPPGPLPAVPASHRWRLPAAVGLTVVVIATAVSLSLGGGPPATPSADAGPPALPLTLGGDQLPSLFGYRVADATARLSSFALHVEVSRVESCEPAGLVLATTPAIGSKIRPGDTISLTVARPQRDPCGPGRAERRRAWAFVGFASGHGRTPAFAREVTVVNDGGTPLRLTRKEAESPDSWAGPLRPVADTAARIGVSDQVYIAPSLRVTNGVPPALACGIARPEALRRRTALELSMTLPTEGGSCPLTVDLYRTGGAIDAVVVRSPRPQGTEPGGTP